MVSERIDMHNEYDTEKMSNDFSKSKSTKLRELSKPPKYLSNCTTDLHWIDYVRRFRGRNFVGFVHTQTTVLLSSESFNERQCHGNLCPTRADRTDNNQ